MSVILPKIPARLRRMLGRFVGPAGAALFSLVLASCAGGGFGGAPDTPAVNPVSQPAPAASGPISPESQRNVAEVVSGLKLGDETPPISPQDIAVSDDAEILNRNPFSSPPPAARASGWGARADSTRKTPGYKAFEIAVPSENPLMTVAVWISETPPDYPEGKPEQDPEADRKFLYLRLQVFIAVGHVALVEGGGVEVLESQVIVVEEKRPDPKPQPVTLEAVTAETVCESGSLSANGLTQAQLDYEFLGAVLENDLEGACEYLRRGANIEIREDEVGRPYNLSALMIAAGRGGYNYPDMTRLLLANGAKTDARDGSGWVTALHYAAASGHTETAALILDWGGDVNVLSSTGDPPLYQAAHWGRADVVQLLLSRGADPDIQADTGVSPLHGAASNVARSGSAAVVSLLLSYDADPNLPRSRSNPGLITRAGETGHSPLDDLVARGYGNYAEAARILRDAGGKCFVRTSPLCPVPEVVTAETVCESGSLSANGLTQAQLDAGLISAAEGDDLPGACEYLRRGANVDARESGRYYKRTALMIATTDGRLGLAKLLYANGADVNLAGGNHDGYDVGRGWTALQYSGAAGRPELAGWLLDSGAELNSEWVTGKTALWEAAYWGRPDVVKLLLSRGAETNGGGALLHAAVLLDEGGWVSARRYWANGPAFRYKRNAISYSYPTPTADEHGQVVSLLLSHDAEVNARYQGRSPLDYAARQGDERLSAMLRDAGGICYVETGALCGAAEVVTAETVCESGSLSSNGQTQAQLDAGLITAAEGNDLAGACEYLRRGANVDARESGRYYKRTALMIATTDGRLELAKLLYANGADVNLAGGNHNGYDVGRGWTALQYSGAAGRPELAGWLLDSGAELNSEWESGKTALWEAAYWGRPDVVELLLSRGAETETYYNGGATPLHAAVLLDEWVSARVYWANGPAFRYKRNAISYSYPIPTANEHGQVVSLLLSHDAEVNARYQGRSPLDYAARQGDERLSAMLRDAGGICYAETGPLCGVADVATAVTTAVTLVVTAETVCESGSLSADGLTQAQLNAGLISAADGNDLPEACEYLRRGANVNARESGRYYKRTALMIAANDGRLELAKLLRANGADVNLHGGNHDGGRAVPGWSALHYAAAAGHAEMAGWLLDAGAGLETTWDGHKTALWEAAYWGRPEVAAVLLSRGADSRNQDGGSVSALRMAVYDGPPGWRTSSWSYRRMAISYSYPKPSEDALASVISLLAAGGADVNERRQNRSVLDDAVSRNRARFAEVLREFGGKCVAETGPLCGVADVATAVTTAVTLVVTSETVCESGSLSADGLTQAQLNAGLISAADGNDLPEACEYLRRGANVNARESGRYYKRTALMIAANDGRLELAKLLRANGADVNLHGGNHDGGRAVPGWSALHYAAAAGHAEMAGWLLDAGAGLETTWDGHKTALWEAAYWGRPEVAAVLLSRGADSRNQDGGSVSALRMAVYDGPPGWRTSSWSYRRMAISYSYPKPSEDALASVISLLAAGGADVNERRQNRSVLDDAVSRNRARFAEVLREFGGKCVAETGPLCGVADVATAVTTAVTLVVTSETVCESGSLSADGLTQAQLNAGLISAADGNDLPEACEYLRRGANVNARESGRYYKRTALMIAANDGRLELAKLLRANGADVNLHGGNHDGGRAVPGWSALHYAAAAGHAEMAGWLLDAGAGLETTWDGHKTALWEAAYWGRPEVAAVLLSRGADSRNQDGGSVSALRMAVYDGPPGWRTSSWSYRRMAISYSYPKPSENALASVISLLAAGGADVNERRQNRSVLDDAVSRNRARFAEVLREFGGKCVAETGPLCGVADVATAVTTAVTLVVTSETVCESGSLSADGLTQAQLNAGLISAADGNDLPEACEYLRRGANVNARESGRYYKRTALMIAANDGRLELAKLLRANGADVNLHGGNHDGGRAVPGWSALHYAAAAGHAEMAGWLLDAGAGLETTWDGHKTALWEAAYWGRPEVAAVLLSRGADSRNQDGGSVSALRMAVYDGPPGWRTSSWSYRRMAISYSYPKPSENALASVISLLAAGGADVNERRQNRSVLDDAVSRNRARFAEVLREFGGKCVAETGPLCGVADVATAVTTAVTLEAVTSETVCESGSLSANGQTQAQLNAGLISAAKANNLTSACEYLRRGASPDSRESRGVFNRTALMIAASDGRLDLAKLLHGNGADVNQQKGQMNHWAYASPGWSALIYAATAGHADMVSWLLDSGADIEAYWHSPGKKTALWEAAHWGRADVIGILLSHGADPDRSDASDAFPLHGGAGKLWGGAATPSNVVMVGYSRMGEDEAVNVVSLLAAAVSDVNALENGKTALDVAASQNRPEVAAVLRNAGGKCVVETGPLCPVVEVVTAETVTVTAETVCESGSLSANGQTQAQLDAGLVSAVKANNLTSACEYLRRGASPDSRESRGVFNRTALMIAASDGRLDLAKLLHVNGADVNLQKGQMNRWAYASPGWSALIYAATAGHADMVSWLLDSGADIEAYWHSPGKKTALWEAAHWGRADVIDILLSHGADPDRSDASDAFPLHGGAGKLWGGAATPSNVVMVGYSRMGENEAVNVVSLLAAAVSDVNALENGKTALDLAASQNRPEVAAVLRNAGGKCVAQTGPLCGIPDVAVEYAVIPADESGGTVSATGDDGALSHEDEVRQGTTLTFTATPASGWMLSAWGGDAADCSGLVCALAADSDLSVHAEFSPILSLTDLSCPAGTLPTNGLTVAELNMTLRMAARGGDATRVCEALRRGAEVNDNLDDSEFTPLQEAVSGGHLEAAKVLLANGAEVNKRKGGAGHSPLDLAARDGEAEIAALLRNADGRCFVETGPLCQNVPVATPDPVTVVNTVAATVASTVVATVANTVVAEVENTVAATVAAGACPAGTLPTNGMTQAQLDYEFLGAVLENDLEGACEYLRQGANIEIREDEVGRPHNLSALMIAAGRGGYNYPDMTRLLLANGAKTDARDGSGWVTALHYAAASGHTETAALILDWGGDVNVLSSTGDPPLYQAAHWGRRTWCNFCFRAARIRTSRRTLAFRRCMGRPLMWRGRARRRW